MRLNNSAPYLDELFEELNQHSNAVYLVKHPPDDNGEPLTDKLRVAIAKHLNKDHLEDMLACAKGIAGLDWALDQSAPGAALALPHVLDRALKSDLRRQWRVKRYFPFIRFEQ